MVNISNEKILITISEYVKMLRNLNVDANYQTVYSSIRRGHILNYERVEGKILIIVDRDKYFACTDKFDKICNNCCYKKHLDSIKSVVNS